MFDRMVAVPEIIILGINQAYDHYNAYAFHFYGLMWTHLHGAMEPARALRWRDWAKLFVTYD